MRYIKAYENINGDEIIVGIIRYSDDKNELIPLTEMGVDYVLRQGDTKTAYYKLDYNAKNYYNYSFVEEYGYAPLGEEIPDSFFQGKKIKYIDSIYTKVNKYNL